MSEPTAFDAIHEHLRQLERSAEEFNRRIEVKLDKAVDDHEIRLRALERWRYALPTSLVLAVGSVMAALAQTWRK